jgi:ComF family protein
MWSIIYTYLKDFFNLFYPSICCACGNHLYDGEERICIACRMSMPYTNDEQIKRNATYKVFEGRVRVEAASSLFYFKKKSKVQNVLHYLKYKNHEELGIVLGSMHAEQLSKSELFKEVDLVIPVPLHPNKFKKRGYNQAALLAKGYSQVLNAMLDEQTLIRVEDTSTQTRKNRYERYENMNEMFKCMDVQMLSGKNILLIDDVITTGSTIESCASELLKAGCNKVYVASIALA